MVAWSAALIKLWEGNLASISKLCGIPFVGVCLFRPELNKVLERSADAKIRFPVKKLFVPNKGFCKGSPKAHSERPGSREAVVLSGEETPE